MHNKNTQTKSQITSEERKPTEQITLACATGHSGGHIVPCLTIATRENPEKIIFFSTNSKLDMQLLAKNETIHWHVPLNVHPPRSRMQLPLHLIALTSAFFKSLYHLHRTKPAKLISTGGLVAVPVCMAAWVLRIPIELYELNAVPGKAIKFLAPFSTKIYVCFAQAQKSFSQERCERFEYPLRFHDPDPSILRDERVQKSKLLDELIFSPNKKTIFILGGSQGSHFINQAIKRALREHPELAAQLQIIHQTGASDTIDYQSKYQELGIPAHVFTFDNNLARYYAIADLVIARAGAGTIFETLHFKTPCILIPLETKATDHQVDNALAIANEYPEQFSMVRQAEIEQDTAQLVAMIYKQLPDITSKELHEKNIPYADHF